MQEPQFLDAFLKRFSTHPDAPVKLLVAKCDRISLSGGEGRCVTGGMPAYANANAYGRSEKSKEVP